MLLAADLSLNLVALVAVIGLVGGGMAAFLRVRGETRAAIETVTDKRVHQAQTQTDHWRESFQAENVRANQLAMELKEQRELKHAVMAERDALSLRTDLSGLMRQLTDNFTSINRRIDGVEERLTKRMDAFVQTQAAQTAALEAIATRLEALG